MSFIYFKVNSQLGTSSGCQSTIQKSSRYPERRAKISADFDLAFGKNQPFFNRPVVQVMMHLAMQTEIILERFAAIASPW
jgi:hypothetical protein